jgi:transcriptional regulator with XRE-family HTH domain
MAEADTLTSLSPKELGRHLRDVRRRKGLSLSEVARGAGLTRRELNAYEKGRVPIPESDLFVIAGSCGVEVSELRAPRSAPELAAADTDAARGDEGGTAPIAPLPVPTTIEDTVAQLRRSQEVAAPSVPAVSGRRRPRALGAPAAPPPPAPPPPPNEPASDEWSIEHIDPLEAVQWPTDASIASPAAYGEPSPAEPVDVFEELARLGDPVPEASGAVDDDMRVEDEPVVVEMPAPEELEFSVSAADAPPIDVAARVESYASPWDALRGDGSPMSGETFASPADSGDLSFAERPFGEHPFAEHPFAEHPFSEHPFSEHEDTEWDDVEAESWDAPDDTSSTFGDADADHFAIRAEAAFDWGTTTDDGVEAAVDAWATAEVTDAPADAWDAAVWPAPDESTEPTDAFDPRFAATVAWAETEPDTIATEPVAPVPVPWTHEPDPEATSTGFYVDWGDANDALAAGPDPALADFGSEPDSATTWGDTDASSESAATDAAESAPTDWTTTDWATTDRATTDRAATDRAATDWAATGSAPAAVAPEAPPGELAAEPGFEPEPPATWADTAPDDAAPIDTLDDLPVISWRPQWEDAALAPAAEAGAVAVALDDAPAWVEGWAAAGTEAETPAETQAEAPADTPGDTESPSEPGPEHRPDEHFVVAGAEWELGNAVPLVEVRSTGSLVMRRADERWALADVTATSNFALEAYVDLRGGPGFGVLFRAEVDTDGRMSGYSFDIDPVYEGGSYLVREWRADRELWNPIAHVPASDPEAMHGLLAVRVTVDDERLVASVNGTDVLTVDNLKEASAERGRDGAAGNRVGIQAWSSTDLVIDELRVAEH